MRPATPSWKRSLLITVVVSLAILLTGEATFRVWDYFFRHPYRRFDPHLGMVRPVPNYHASFNGSVLRINSMGFRAPEFRREKPSGAFRIIMLGDSVTFGLPGDDCHYPGVLQRLFDADGRGPVEVINAALEGYNSEDALRLLEGELMGYSPDMVTVLIGWNDLVKQDPARPDISPLQARLAYALFDVYLIKFWRKVVYMELRPALLRPETDLAPNEEEAFQRYVPLVYKEHLQKIISTARAGGSAVVLFTLPSLLRPGMSSEDVEKLFFPHFTYNLRKYLLLYDRYNETIRAAGRTNRLPVIELQEPLRGRESAVFMDTVHLDCEGSQILGRYLHGVLSPLIQERRGGSKMKGRERS